MFRSHFDNYFQRKCLPLSLFTFKVFNLNDFAIGNPKQQHHRRQLLGTAQLGSLLLPT